MLCVWDRYPRSIHQGLIECQGYIPVGPATVDGSEILHQLVSLSCFSHYLQGFFYTSKVVRKIPSISKNDPGATSKPLFLESFSDFLTFC